MANGFGSIDKWEEWLRLSPEQREYEHFRILQNLDIRLACLEKRPWFDKCLAFAGGVIGGVAAVFGMRAL